MNSLSNLNKTSTRTFKNKYWLNICMKLKILNCFGFSLLKKSSHIDYCEPQNILLDAGD